MPTKRVNLKGRTANISLHRNGLTIEIPNVPAVDAGLVSAELLRMVRTLTKPFPELTLDLGTLGAGAGIEVSEDAEDAEAKGKVVGFTVR